ncbi:MAG: hypothetical protein KatS3mg077_2447 [Candidatus Binatia bacterium]|nr:MAG: hypothetical protein KatS3mg077_2447 [Candidatus Binatia bacterium]
MNFLPVVSLAAAIGAALLAIVVGSQRSQNPPWAFVFMTAMVAGWNMYLYALYTLPCHEGSLAVLTPLRVTGLVLPTSIIFFMWSLRARHILWHFYVAASAVISAVLVGANFAHLVVEGVRRHSFGCYSVAGPLYHLFTAEVVMCFLGALALCIQDLRKATDARDRLIARYWLISAAVGLPLGVTNLLPAYGVPIYPLGNLGSVAWAGVVAYAILRHRLLDVEIWISRLGTAFAAGMLTIVPAYALLVWLQIYALGSAHIDLSTAVLLSLVAVAAAFPFLQRRFEQAFAKRAFPYKIEQQTSFEMLRRAVLQEKNHDRLVEIVAKGLSAIFHPPSVAVFTRKAEAQALRLAYHLGPPPIETSFAFGCPLVDALEHSTLSLLQSELSESRQPRAREVGELLGRLGWTVCVPVKTPRQLCGFISLGLKGGRDWYMLTELEALERLGEELALALENIRLEEQAQLARQSLERVERLSAIGTMVAGIVHEVRNPLVAFSTFMHVAKERKGDPELIAASAPVIISELERVQRLLDELLHATRGNPPQFGAVDLVQAANEVAGLIKPAAKQARVLVELQGPEDPIEVFADGDRVRQVLFNLGLNAIEASKEGSTVTIFVERVSRNGYGFGEVRVRDTGNGLPAELREKVFQPFFTTKPNGTGLGLALCLQIVQEHGGYLEIRDPDGQGTIFAAGFPEFVPEVHRRLMEGVRPDEVELTPEEEAHVRSLVGNIKLPPEVLRVARQIRIKR